MHSTAAVAADVALGLNSGALVAAMLEVAYALAVPSNAAAAAVEVEVVVEAEGGKTLEQEVGRPIVE